MSFQDLEVALFAMWPISTIIIAGILLVYLIARYIAKIRIQGQLSLITAFGALGGFLGYATGASRETIIGTVLPTLLTLITLLLGYLFGKDAAGDIRPIIPYFLIVIILNAFLGLFLGLRAKRGFEEFTRDYNRDLLRYERVDLEVEKAKRLKELETTKDERGKKPEQGNK